MTPLLSQFIDLCRWAGALLVLGVHSQNAFVNLADIMTAPHSIFVYLSWFFVSFGFGHPALVAFFVMSGYLVGGAVISQARGDKPFLQHYLIHRFTRVYIVLAPAILLTAVLDGVGRFWFAGAGVYDSPAFAGRFTPTLAFTTALNLQEIYFPFFGTNGPLWSLACEFWYYVTFPLLLLPVARQYSPLVRAAGFALGVVLVIVLAIPDSWFLTGYGLWALGALASLAPRAIIRSRWISAALYLALLLPIRLLVRGPYLEAFPFLQTASDYASTIVFLNLMLAVRDSPPESWRILHTPLHKQLADFSFSLYCVHLPLLILMRAAAMRWFGAEWGVALATGEHWIAFGVGTVVCIGVGYGFSLLTEAHTTEARRSMRRAFDRLNPLGGHAPGTVK